MRYRPSLLTAVLGEGQEGQFSLVFQPVMDLGQLCATAFGGNGSHELEPRSWLQLGHTLRQVTLGRRVGPLSLSHNGTVKVNFLMPTQPREDISPFYG